MPAAAAESYPWAAPVAGLLDPTMLLLQTVMLGRVIISWFPEINPNKIPWNFIAWPAEPLLKPTRALVPPAFGVDISPIIWIAIASLIRELLLGQYGILIMMQTRG